MNKYIELSDFEINKRIAELDTKNKYSYFEREQTVFKDFSNGASERYDPCNNPADGWPIIIDNDITIIPCSSYNNEHTAYANFDIGPYSWDSHYAIVNVNPLRACMEIYLFIKDAESENNNDN